MRRKLFVCFAGLLLVFTVRGQVPVAAFTVSPQSGCLSNGTFFVSCTNTSTNATSYSFNYGDGSAATTSPIHNYTTAGSFTITLTATNANGSSTSTQSVNVFGPPAINFTTNPTSGCYPLNVQFTDNSTTASGTLTSWNWDFGDGVTSALQNPSHVFTTSGNPTVTLIVKNSNGCAATLQQTPVSIPNGVTAAFTSNNSSSNCALPIPVTFTNQSTGGAPGITYSWDFGDGTTSATANPSHNYNASGTFLVTLIATSSSGCADTIQNPVSLNGGSLQSNFTAPDSVCIGTAVVFQNTSAPPPSSSSWNFGDGTSTIGLNATHTYNTPNTYTVQLTNVFGTCPNVITKNVVVLPVPVAGFNADVLVGCKTPQTVNFTDQSSNGTQWLWRFGDGTTSNLQNPSHTYTGYGSFDVTLIVSNVSGCLDSLVKKAYVVIAQPVIKISNLPGFGCIPYAFTPTLTGTVPDGISSYAWNFGDGTTASTANPSHTYIASGVYAVSLTITTNGGCTATTVDTVKAGTNKPTAQFSLSANPICTSTATANKSVTFTDQSSPTPNHWLWDFGDGSLSTTQSPTHSYSQPGTYTVLLSAYNSTGCYDTISHTIVVSPPYANFIQSIDCVNKGQVTFTSNSIADPGATYLWNFGDGTTSAVASPVHVYPAGVAVYIPILTVTENGCTSTVSGYVPIINVTAAFTGPASICENSVATFSSNISNPANVKSSSWDFGDGTVVSGGTSVSHIFKSRGNYTVTLTLTDINNCPNVITNPITVNGPTAAFTATNTTGCKGLSPVFTDQSTSDGTNNITTWIWDFGDGTVQTFSAPPFTHSYITQGIFTVKLKVIDASGCFDSTARNNLVSVTVPAALFNTADSMSCIGSPVQFINNSNGTGLTYGWTLGDGSTSAVAAPAHSYAAIGTYSVKLKITDAYGCADSLTKINYISIDTPIASFKMSDSVSTCPPLQVNFTFTGHYNQSVKWSFGDGSTSTLLNPTHYYVVPGNYIPTLVVTSPGGCTNTATDTIKVSGPYGVLTYTPLVGCNTLTVQFNVTTTEPLSHFIWDFNNGITQATTIPSVTYQYTSIGNYLPQVILQDASGCNVAVPGTDTIAVQGSTPQFGIDKNLLCGSGTIQFSDSTTSNGVITGYLWDFGDGNTDATRNPSHFYTTPGLYTVKLVVTIQGGCQDSVVKNALIKVVATPSVDINGVLSQCVPSTLTFTGVILVPDTSALSWHWNFFNGQTAAVQNPPAKLYNAAGQDSVQLIVINSSGCADTVVKDFLVYPLPPTYAGADTTICLGQSIQLQATGAASYNWLPPNNTLSCTTNCANPVATPVVTTSYVVNGTSTFGCQQKAAVVVNVVQPQTISLTPLTDSICIGQSVSLIASGETIYLWTPAAGLSDPAVAAPVASPDSTTTYQVVGSDSRFCFSDTQYVKISVFNYPTINVGPDITLPVGSSYQINGIGSADIDSITWTPVTGLSCSNCLSPLASPVNSTDYIIKVTNNGGCSTTDSLNIIVTCNNNNLFIPNTFSPNGDGMNDVFYVRGKGLSTIQSMRIFNRWGQLVFEKRDFAPNDPSVGWDGTFNGKKAPVDVYIYTVEVICENSVVVPYHGNVALIR